MVFGLNGCPFGYEYVFVLSSIELAAKGRVDATVLNKGLRMPFGL